MNKTDTTPGLVLAYLAASGNELYVFHANDSEGLDAYTADGFTITPLYAEQPASAAVEWQFRLREWPADSWNRIDKSQYEDYLTGKGWTGSVDDYELRALSLAAARGVAK